MLVIYVVDQSASESTDFVTKRGRRGVDQHVRFFLIWWNAFAGNNNADFISSSRLLTIIARKNSPIGDWYTKVVSFRIVRTLETSLWSLNCRFKYWSGLVVVDVNHFLPRYNRIQVSYFQLDKRMMFHSSDIHVEPSKKCRFK